MIGKVVFFVRHLPVEGENLGGLKDPHNISASLSDDGKKQIPRIVEFFRHFQTTLVVAGDAPRYLEVAKPISREFGIPLQINSRLIQSSGNKRPTGAERVVRLISLRKIILRLIEDLPDRTIVVTGNIYIQSLFFGEDITIEEVERKGELYRTKPGCGVIYMAGLLLPFEI